MARRRYFRPQDAARFGPRINGFITRDPVRLIDENDQMVGIVSNADAQRRAQEAELDLVEVSPEADPPVCKIRDFGKWKYEQSKKDKANRAKSRTAELKEVRLGRSMKIDPHDIEIRLTQARRFLMEGHKVQIVQNFRGREMIHRQKGTERMNDIIESLSDISKVEMSPRQTGRRMTMMLAPDKAKIDQIKRRDAAEKSKEKPKNTGSAKASSSSGAASSDAGDPADTVGTEGPDQATSRRPESKSAASEPNEHVHAARSPR